MSEPGDPTKKAAASSRDKKEAKHDLAKKERSSPEDTFSDEEAATPTSTGKAAKASKPKGKKTRKQATRKPIPSKEPTASPASLMSSFEASTDTDSDSEPDSKSTREYSPVRADSGAGGFLTSRFYPSPDESDSDVEPTRVRRDSSDDAISKETLAEALDGMFVSIEEDLVYGLTKDPITSPFGRINWLFSKYELPLHAGLLGRETADDLEQRVSACAGFFNDPFKERILEAYNVLKDDAERKAFVVRLHTNMGDSVPDYQSRYEELEETVALAKRKVSSREANSLESALNAASEGYKARHTAAAQRKRLLSADASLGRSRTSPLDMTAPTSSTGTPTGPPPLHTAIHASTGPQTRLIAATAIVIPNIADLSIAQIRENFKVAVKEHNDNATDATEHVDWQAGPAANSKFEIISPRSGKIGTVQKTANQIEYKFDKPIAEHEADVVLRAAANNLELKSNSVRDIVNILHAAENPPHNSGDHKKTITLDAATKKVLKDQWGDMSPNPMPPHIIAALKDPTPASRTRPST